MSDQPWTCAEIERHLFELLRGQLAPHDEMRARAHMEDCADCAARATRWDAWTAPLMNAVTAPLPSDMAARMVSRAMSIELSAPQAPVRAATRWPYAVAVLAAAFAAVALWPRAPLPPAPAALEPVLANVVDGAQLTAQPLALGKAKVQVRGRAHFENAHSAQPVLALEQGDVDVSLDPLGRDQELRVCTKLTCVRVVGTAFNVAHGLADTIAVAHGVVAVSPAGMPELEIVLHAGETFTTPWRSTPVAPRAVDPLEGKTAAQLMAAGEALLAKRDRAGAREVFDELQRRFPRSDEADAAAFAFADTVPQLSRYLQRHPGGAFVEDALWRLSLLHARANHNQEARQSLRWLLDVTRSDERRAQARTMLDALEGKE